MARPGNPGGGAGVLLLANYAPDGQQSMLRFAALMEESLGERGVRTERIQPAAGAVARLGRGPLRRWSKWLGYIDKYGLFPGRLRRRLRTSPAAVVHVLDHANAVYVPRTPDRPWVVTCHDLLAVRGALGEDTDCPASALGRRLQGAVCRGLARAQAVVCDSTSTREDLDRIVRPCGPQARRVTLLSQNHAYRRQARPEALQTVRDFAGIPWSEPFLLHVGSNLPRKNKACLIRVLSGLKGRWSGNVVLCGPGLPTEIAGLARELGVADRVHGVPSPGNRQLEAVYSLAHALLFPSRCEGFGWPVIEAQACGCPVICSDRTSLPEIAGRGALVFPVTDEDGMAGAVLRLQDAHFRDALVDEGFRNLERFDRGRMVDDYCAVYAEMIQKWQQ